MKEIYDLAKGKSLAPKETTIQRLLDFSKSLEVEELKGKNKILLFKN